MHIQVLHNESLSPAAWARRMCRPTAPWFAAIHLSEYSPLLVHMVSNACKRLRNRRHVVPKSSGNTRVSAIVVKSIRKSCLSLPKPRSSQAPASDSIVAA